MARAGSTQLVRNAPGSTVARQVWASSRHESLWGWCREDGGYGGVLRGLVIIWLALGSLA